MKMVHDVGTSRSGPHDSDSTKEESNSDIVKIEPVSELGSEKTSKGLEKKECVSNITYHERAALSSRIAKDQPTDSDELSEWEVR